MSISIEDLQEIRDRLNSLLEQFPHSMDRLCKASTVVNLDYGEHPRTCCTDLGTIMTQGVLGFLNTALDHPTHALAIVEGDERHILGFQVVLRSEFFK